MLWLDFHKNVTFPFYKNSNSMTHVAKLKTPKSYSEINWPVEDMGLEFWLAEESITVDSMFTR